MIKAYCISSLNNEAKQILKKEGIELTINKNLLSKEELISVLEKYDILIINIYSKLTADMVKYIKKPIIIATLSVGLDHIDESFFNTPLVTIVNVKTGNSISVAEHIFGLILSLNKRIAEGNKLVLEKENRSKLQKRPEDISGKTLGLIGFGSINQEVMKVC